MYVGTYVTISTANLWLRCCWLTGACGEDGSKMEQENADGEPPMQLSLILADWAARGGLDDADDNFAVARQGQARRLLSYDVLKGRVVAGFGSGL